MLERLKRFMHQLVCNHDMELQRWHWVHFPNYEPLSIEAEYKCPKCEKIKYVHLYGTDGQKFANAMGNYKKQ